MSASSNFCTLSTSCILPNHVRHVGNPTTLTLLPIRKMPSLACPLSTCPTYLTKFIARTNTFHDVRSFSPLPEERKERKKQDISIEKTRVHT